MVAVGGEPDRVIGWAGEPHFVVDGVGSLTLG